MQTTKENIRLMIKIALQKLSLLPFIMTDSK